MDEINSLFSDFNTKLEKTISFLQEELKAFRTQRANISFLDPIKIDSYGQKTPLNQLANLNLLDHSTISIEPWDKSIIKEIEKTLQQSNLGVGVINEGTTLKLNIPPLTEERRKELIKLVHKKGEETKISLRNLRREINEKVKKLEKEGLAKDESKKALDRIQKLLDQHISQVEQIISKKEKDLLDV